MLYYSLSTILSTSHSASRGLLTTLSARHYSYFHFTVKETEEIGSEARLTHAHVHHCMWNGATWVNSLAYTCLLIDFNCVISAGSKEFQSMSVLHTVITCCLSHFLSETLRRSYFFLNILLPPAPLFQYFSLS